MFLNQSSISSTAYSEMSFKKNMAGQIKICEEKTTLKKNVSASDTLVPQKCFKQNKESAVQMHEGVFFSVILLRNYK